MQPAWSPDGSRIAFWGLRGQTGQRDLWTVAADGSDAAERQACRSPKTRRSTGIPTWSPDGRYLYFSSTRGGPINLWRVAHRPALGPAARRAGAGDDAVDVERLPVVLARRIAAGLCEPGLPIDPAARAVRRRARGVDGPAEPILKGTRAIRDHELSPDGEWVAFTEAGVPEDLFVARVDGSQYRRLTDDAFRDRGPAWSPDGSAHRVLLGSVRHLRPLDDPP